MIEEEGRGKSEDVASKSRCVVSAAKPVAVPVEECILRSSLHEFRDRDGGHLEFLDGDLHVIGTKFYGFCFVSKEKVETVGRNGARTLEVACQILWCEFGGGGDEFSDARVRGRIEGIGDCWRPELVSRIGSWAWYCGSVGRRARGGLSIDGGVLNRRIPVRPVSFLSGVVMRLTSWRR